MSFSVRYKRVLILGGTGSLGLVLIRRLLEKKDISDICVFSRTEEKRDKVRSLFPNVGAYLGDIRDKSSVKKCIRLFRPDIIINAVAMKDIVHVEDFPLEGLKTNTLGCQNVVEAIEESDSGIISLAISTDKAVESVNSYGMTKALQERLWLRGSGNSTFNAVRYGNVLSSRASVVPRFKKLIEEGKNLTVTHPEMTRFFLSLDESVDLIFSALEDNAGRRIFVPKIRSAKLNDFAEILIEMSGKKVGIDYIGVRPGEKLHESLISEEENYRTEEVENLLVVHDVLKPYKDYGSKFLKKVVKYSSNSPYCLMSKEELKVFLTERGIL